MRMTVPPEAMTKISSSSDDHERGHDVAPAGGELDAPDALAAAALAGEVLELGALAVAGIGDDEDGGVVAGHVAGHELVALLELHAPHTRPPTRPMGRTSSSSKRTVMPVRLTMKMSSPSLAGMTLTSSSPSRRFTAMMPARSDESYSVNLVFLTWPFLVAKNRYWLVS